MKNTQKRLFELLRVVMFAEPLREETKVGLTEKNLIELYTLSKRHDLAHLLAEALDKNGLLDKKSGIAERFQKERRMAVYRYEQIHYETEAIYAVLEEAKIPYMPLKGAIIRDYYPEPWMRTSCDIDVLIQEQYLEQALNVLENQLGYKKKIPKLKGYQHDVSLYAENGVHLELHYNLIESEHYSLAAKLLSDVWENAKLAAEYTYRYEMKKEYFYFYHIAHMVKHFQIAGGCGIRPFLDLWLLKNREEYTQPAVEELLKKGKLLTFAQKSLELAAFWFAEGASNDLIEEMETYVLMGGVYGTVSNYMALQRSKKGGKFKYVLYKIFLPYKEMKIVYPVLQKKKWLYPLYQIRRWCRLLFCGISHRSKQELKWNAKLSKEHEDRVAGLMYNLGL